MSAPCAVTPFAHVSLTEACGFVARALLGAPAPRIALGSIDLAPHQLDAVARLRSVMARHGGALLADAVGLGKTYVALGLLAESERGVIIAPAALRRMWHDAMERAGVAASFVSTQRLSGRRLELPEPDLVVIDEAHHFRNPATRRYAALAELARRSRVLLLTATPVHNDPGELAALLALFLGDVVSTASPTSLAEYIVRRERMDGAREDAGAPASSGAPSPSRVTSSVPWSASAPQVEPLRWLELTQDDALLDMLAALPPPVPPSDGDEGGALVLFSLLRAWTSSEGALIGALKRRAARAAALIAALEEGRHPSRAELAAWRFADDALQLAFPGLVVADERHAPSALLAQARAHETAVRDILHHLRDQASADRERAALIRALRVEHGGERIVLFSQFSDTIDALWRELRMEPGVCALSGRGARVAGGKIARRDAIARFSPTASGRADPPPAERTDLLLATDLLSEGVNLQDASVLVHLDLPWTAARIEQRVGRLARPGAARDRVVTCAFAPPASAERVLAVERRLRAKLDAAARSVGVSGTILPAVLGAVAVQTSSPAQHREATRRVVRRWLDRMPNAELGGTVVACASSRRAGFIALVRDGADSMLVAAFEGALTDDPSTIVEAVELIDAALARQGEFPGIGGKSPLAECTSPDEVGCTNTEAVRARMDRVERWLAFRQGAHDATLHLVGADGVRRKILRRIASTITRAPAHLRPRIAPLAAEARRAATARLPAGAERVLRELADARLPDEAWLRAIGAFGVAQGHGSSAERGDAASCREHRAPAVLALIVLVDAR